MDKEKIDTQIEYLINRIKKNEKLLRKWRAKENITCNFSFFLILIIRYSI